MLEERVALLGL
jgi:hypothetical protein